MKVFGKRDVLSIEAGTQIHDTPTLRHIEIWACGQRVTHVDNIAYKPEIVVGSQHDLGAWSRVTAIQNSPLADLGPIEAHEYILSTRDENSENYGLNDDELWYLHSVLDWGPNTDYCFNFLVQCKNDIFITAQIINEDQSLEPTQVTLVSKSEWEDVMAAVALEFSDDTI